ncbi:hypothetical protein KR054_011513 [Drosophila jambulina]|nr:hypothetical protein KR054_011513 [Drosophila jambulina]
MSKETYKVALELLERFDEKREVHLQTKDLQSQQQQLPVVQELPRRTPFPIVDDRTRSALVRFLDFILGDGPQNRFGMICKECHAHNGMLPKEEYEYAAFWCSACNVLNQARKVRPVAPCLQLEVPQSADSTKSSESFN